MVLRCSGGTTSPAAASASCPAWMALVANSIAAPFPKRRGLRRIKAVYTIPNGVPCSAIGSEGRRKQQAFFASLSALEAGIGVKQESGCGGTRGSFESSGYISRIKKQQK